MEMNSLRAALPFIVLITSLALAEGDSNFRTYAQHAIPNVDLPPRVKVPDGEVGIYADFDQADATGVPLYVVNKSPATVSLGTEEGEFGVRLEAKKGNGWARAQTHEFSWCGNSYSSRRLPSGMHFRVLGYRPAQGQKGTVRYSLATAKQQVVSNAGAGFFSPADVENSRYDGESLSGVPHSLRDAFSAKEHVEKMSPPVRAVCLDLLQAYGDVPALKRNAERQLQEWKASGHLTTEDKEAMNAFAVTLAKPWETERSAIRLLDRCAVLLKSEPEVAMPKSQEMALAWRLAAELAANGGYDLSQPSAASQQQCVPMAYWKEIVALAVTKIVNAPEQEASNMAWLLRYTPLVDTFVTDDQLEPLLRSINYGTARVAADALARRGKTERLAELAMDLPTSSQADVFAALAFGGGYAIIDEISGSYGTRTPPENSKEEAFWKQFTAAHIDQVAFALMVPPPPLPPPPPSGIDDSQFAAISQRAVRADSFGPLVGERLRTYLQREAERSKASKNDFPLPKEADHITYSVELLAKSKRRTDIPLFRLLLRYRGYELQNGYRTVQGTTHVVPSAVHCFSVRESVLNALKAMDQDVPRDVVLSRDASDPDHIIETTNAPPTAKP